MEVVMSMAIAAVAASCIVSGYLFSSSSVEHSGASLAASSLAQRTLEQTRAAKWDTKMTPVVDELVASNFPVSVSILDVPQRGSNVVYATNYTRISTVSTNPALRMIQVDCVWRFMNRGLTTNTILTYRAPD